MGPCPDNLPDRRLARAGSPVQRVSSRAVRTATTSFHVEQGWLRAAEDSAVGFLRPVHAGRTGAGAGSAWRWWPERMLALAEWARPSMVRELSQGTCRHLLCDQEATAQLCCVQPVELAEAVTIFAARLVVALGEVVRRSEADLRAHISQRLSEGSVDPVPMRELSAAVDRYIAGVLAQAGVSRTVALEAMGAFAPTPPPYTEPFSELSRRLVARVDVLRQLPRYMDLVLYERVVWRREPAPLVIERLDLPDVAAMGRASRLVAAFLVGQAGLPPWIGQAFANGKADPHDSPQAPQAMERPDKPSETVSSNLVETLKLPMPDQVRDPQGTEN